MADKTIFKTSIGNFVFNSQGKIIDRGQDYEKLKQKYDAEDASEKDIQTILSELKTKEYLVKLRQACLESARAEIKESVSQDLFIVQTSNHIDELAKSINLLSKRLVEWYSYSLPELAEKVQDYSMMAIMVADSTREELMKQINVAEEASMGKRLDAKDEEAIRDFARSIKSLVELKKREEQYLETLMKEQVPNVHALAGSQIGAKLISIAGSLKNLARFPASTVQLLGAEKALFRHIITGARPPKYGILHEHYLVSRSREKGKVARALANKLSIAAKIDYFKGEFVGDKMRQELEEKFK
jgi:nucleolar protein 56